MDSYGPPLFAARELRREGATCEACVMDFDVPCRVQCSLCCKWRIVTYEALQQVSKDTSWTCRQLRSARAFQNPINGQLPEKRCLRRIAKVGLMPDAGSRLASVLHERQSQAVVIGALTFLIDCDCLQAAADNMLDAPDAQGDGGLAGVRRCLAGCASLVAPRAAAAAQRAAHGRQHRP